MTVGKLRLKVAGLRLALAGRFSGSVGKRVLIEDTKRIYETRQGFTREYRWVGEEML